MTLYCGCANDSQETKVFAIFTKIIGLKNETPRDDGLGKDRAGRWGEKFTEQIQPGRITVGKVMKNRRRSATKTSAGALRRGWRSSRTEYSDSTNVRNGLGMIPAIRNLVTNILWGQDHSSWTAGAPICLLQRHSPFEKVTSFLCASKDRGSGRVSALAVQEWRAGPDPRDSPLSGLAGALNQAGYRRCRGRSGMVREDLSYSLTQERRRQAAANPTKWGYGLAGGAATDVLKGVYGLKRAVKPVTLPGIKQGGRFEPDAPIA